ncbi:MAG: hypothetical protein LBP82_02290, partial [Candidatus Methanoplasma sp.]|jgi:hypothetical protein|nr:hypothetical protein [Candidatus Methanoplasma sp.]
MTGMKISTAVHIAMVRGSARSRKISRIINSADSHIITAKKFPKAPRILSSNGISIGMKIKKFD